MRHAMGEIIVCPKSASTTTLTTRGGIQHPLNITSFVQYDP